MCVVKQGSPSSQTIDVRSLRLRMSALDSRPVIQIVDGNQQHIGLLFSSQHKGCRQKQHRKQSQQTLERIARDHRCQSKQEGNATS